MAKKKHRQRGAAHNYKEPITPTSSYEKTTNYTSGQPEQKAFPIAPGYNSQKPLAEIRGYSPDVIEWAKNLGIYDPDLPFRKKNGTKRHKTALEQWKEEREESSSVMQKWLKEKSSLCN